MNFQYDVMVLGRGIVGSLASILLADRSLRLAVLEQNNSPTDHRYFAITEKSKRLFDEIKLELNVQPVREVLVFGDGQGSLQLRQNDNRTLFYTSSAQHIQELLWQKINGNSYIDAVKQPVSAKLKVVCEGQNSLTREHLQVAKDIWPYQQMALAGMLTHTSKKLDQALQWFHKGAHGLEILALLPLDQEDKSAIVWSMPIEKAQIIVMQSMAQQLSDLNEITEPYLTGLALTTPLSGWEIQRMRVHPWSGRDRDHQTWVLVGDSAHGVHPLAGLGLNLGIGDAKLLSTLILDNLVNNPWKGIDHLPTVRKYERQRKADIVWVEWLCDGLHGLFAQPDPWVSQLRNSGLNCLDNSELFKKLILKAIV